MWLFVKNMNIFLKQLLVSDSLTSILIILRFLCKQVKANPPNPPRIPVTEYKDKYMGQKALPSDNGIVERRHQYLCGVCVNWYYVYC